MEKELNYPYISDETLNYLFRVYPNKLPMKEIGSFELGKLVGQQELIEHLKEVQKWNEEEKE